MTNYVGSGSYCYANSLAMILGEFAPPASAVEVLTGSPFGAQVERDGRPYFDPPGWDPDLGLDAAIELLGWTCERSKGGSAEEALDRLRTAAGAGPVLVGPVDVSLLRYHPWTTGEALGDDHWLVVLAVNDEHVLMHDPAGYPYVSLPLHLFLRAWEAEKVTVVDASYQLRSGFRRLREVSVEEALRDSVTAAVSWLSGPCTEAVRALAAEVDAGLGAELRNHLTHFVVPLGARRLDDASTWLNQSGEPEAAAIARHQARLVGRLQYPLLTGDRATALAILTDLTPTYQKLRAALA